MNRPVPPSHFRPERAFETRQSQGWLPRGYIDGMILSNDATDATNDIGISAGVCRSTTCIVDGAGSAHFRDQIDLELPVSIIKQLDVAFAPENYLADISGAVAGGGGARSGGRSISALADGTWHIHALGGRGVATDIILHDSTGFTNATLPSEYSAWRCIGSVVRATSILAFTQDNDTFLLTTPVLDIDTAAPGTSAVTATLASAPTGFKIWALINWFYGGTGNLYISSLDQTDSAASTTAAPLATIGIGGLSIGAGPILVRTNTSAQVRYRATNSTNVRIATLGWIHPRGRNS
jgi:hypothetical protein